VTRTSSALLLIAGSVFVTLLLSEVGLRLVGFDATPVVAPDPLRGWSLAPNMPNMTNSLGMRDRKRSVSKPVGTYRIAVLGDSMTEGVQVELDETFPAVLERRLNENSCFGRRPVEVLNFAVQGYGTAQQYLTLQHHVWGFDPDLLMLGFFPGNDVRDNSRTLKGSAYLPFYDLGDDGKLILDTSFREHWSYRVRTLGANIIRYSRLAQMGNQIRFKLKARLRASSDQEATKAAGLGEVGVDNLVFAAPPPPAWEHAWQLTGALIAQMNKDAQTHGTPFHLAILGTATETHPDPAIPAALAAAVGVEDLSYPRSRLTALGQANDFAVLDLVTPLGKLAAQKQECLHGEPGASPCSGHFTVAGHAALAQHLAAHLCPAGKVP